MCDCPWPADSVRRKMVFSTEDCNDERCAHPDGTLCLNRTSMQPYQFLHQGKSNSAPFMRAASRVFNAVETVKDTRQFLVRDSHTRIADPQLQASPNILQRDGDLPFEGEFEGVRDQVEDDFFPHCPVNVG